MSERVKHKRHNCLPDGMSYPVVLGIYGYSNSGKTTLVERLITTFVKKGYKIATIKKTKKHISRDTEGTDTYRYHAAGANLVVFSSPQQTDILLHYPFDTKQILSMITTFHDLDLVLIEGSDDPDVPKIQVGDRAQRKNTVARYRHNYEEVERMIQKKINQEASLKNVQIFVNGKEIPLTEFPESIITNTIFGMLSSLKGVGAIHDVHIYLTKQQKKKNERKKTKVRQSH